MLNSALNNKVSISEWTSEGITYSAFNTSSTNGNYGRIIIDSTGKFEVYQMGTNGTWNNKNGLITQRSFPEYKLGTRLTISTKKGMTVSKFGYLRSSGWSSSGAEPIIHLWVDNALLLTTKDSKTQNGLMYPVSPGQIIDFYIDQGVGELWFFPCKD